MIIDSSAILAILFGEEDMKIYEAAIAVATGRRLSAGNYLEASIVVESRAGNRGLEQLDALLERATIEVVPVTVDQVRAARRAWREFGKGNPPSRSQLRRLLRLRSCIDYRRTAAIQRR